MAFGKPIGKILSVLIYSKNKQSIPNGSRVMPTFVNLPRTDGQMDMSVVLDTPKAALIVGRSTLLWVAQFYFASAINRLSEGSEQPAKAIL